MWSGILAVVVIVGAGLFVFYMIGLSRSSEKPIITPPSPDAFGQPGQASTSQLQQTTETLEKRIRRAIRVAKKEWRSANKRRRGTRLDWAATSAGASLGKAAAKRRPVTTKQSSTVSRASTGREPTTIYQSRCSQPY